MKKIRRSLALILCMMLAISMLAGCGKKETTDTPSTGGNNSATESTDSKGETDTTTEESGRLEELPLPLTAEKETLSLFTLYENSFIPDPNELPGVQAMEERTNVHIEWKTASLNELQERWGLLLASGELPDLMYVAGFPYPGGNEKGVDDGIFLECTDLIENYMPNYRRFLESDPALMKDAKTDSGRFVCLYAFNSTDHEIIAQSQWTGLSYRKDLMDAWGYTKTPETIDDWHEMLTIAKENGVEAPLLTGEDGYNQSASFMTAYGVYPRFYQEDGVVKYGPAEEGYKEWVELFRQWYAEGLLDPNFVNNAAFTMPDFAYMTTGRSVAFQNLVAFLDNESFYAGFTQDENINIAPVLNPVLNAGDTPLCFNACSPAIGHPCYITADSENPELAAMWLDYQYTDEGMRYNFYGVEGESYNLVDGEIELTDVILNNPEYTPSDALSLYARGNGIGRYNWNVPSHYSDPSGGENMDYWQFNQTFEKEYPLNVSMTEEEGNEYNSIYTSIETLVCEMTVKYIMGTESMDTYDKFVEDLYTYGLEKCIQIKQDALDRYNQR